MIHCATENEDIDFQQLNVCSLNETDICSLTSSFCIIDLKITNQNIHYKKLSKKPLSSKGHILS